MARDDFPTSVKVLLAHRAAMRCASPDCRAATVGPQVGGAGSVNLGVACHITAAAPGGPRYDASMGTEVRRSDANGIWLCQTCAKRVDSDANYYSVALLIEWKAEAERHALVELGVRGVASFYPQPLSTKHTPIPRLGELTYDAARIALIDAGWQPVLRHWADAESLDIRYGNGPHFWEKGYLEIRHACGTGYAFCTFLHQDAYRNRLIVVTAGEVIEEMQATARVWSWYLLGEGEDL